MMVEGRERENVERRGGRTGREGSARESQRVRDGGKGGGPAAKRESHKGEKECKGKDGGGEKGLVREGRGAAGGSGEGRGERGL